MFKSFTPLVFFAKEKENFLFLLYVWSAVRRGGTTEERKG